MVLKSLQSLHETLLAAKICTKLCTKPDLMDSSIDQTIKRPIFKCVCTTLVSPSAPRENGMLKDVQMLKLHLF